VDSETYPDRPSISAFAEVISSEPLPELELGPLTKETDPPMPCDVAPPMIMSPPAPLSPEPTSSVIEPAVPFTAEPVDSKTAPLLPLAEEPDPRETDPLEFVTAAAVCKTISPDPANGDVPEVIATVPPMAFSPKPAEMNTLAATAEVEGPATTEIEPAVEFAAPLDRRMLPELPFTPEPVRTTMEPLEPAESTSAVDKNTKPEPEDTLAPEEMRTLPPV